MTFPLGPSRFAPQAIEAEEAVLGSILINPDAYNEVAPFLKPDDFYIHKHRWIWDAFSRLTEAKLSIDVLTVTNELERHSQLAEVGGTAYLARLINSVPTSMNAEAYGRIVEREATRRRLMESASVIANMAFNKEASMDDLVNDAVATVLAVRRDDDKGAKSVAERSEAYYNDLEARAKDPAAFAGLPTGIIDLDKLTGGLFKSDFTIVAGRPGSGKSAFMLSSGVYLAESPKKPVVAVFSLEMPDNQLMGRVFSDIGEIEAQKFRAATFNDADWPCLVHALERAQELDNLLIDDTSGLTPNSLRAKCRRIQLERGLDVVIVDYLQLMNPDGKFSNRTGELSYITRQVKLMARELDVAMVMGAQLNRAIETRADKKPVLSDLRDSGSIEMDSDNVLFISLPGDEREYSKLYLEKQRNGPTGEVDVYFDKKYSRFRSAATEPVGFGSL